MITTILFDLDGTLLPIEEQPFMELYFGFMAKHFAALGFDYRALIQAVLKSTDSMRANRGPKTNEAVFWDIFSFVSDYSIDDIQKEFLRFYEAKFDWVRPSSKTNPLARMTIELLKSKGYAIALATNPLFPRIATEKRIAWAGLKTEDFLLVTTYENSRATKPSKEYYQGVLNAIEKSAHECLMVGNDANEDMSASDIGIATYLMLDGLINTKNHDLNRFRRGSFEDFFQYAHSLPSLI
jgi:FMN phosphatase YigB (HAD superfamily)